MCNDVIFLFLIFLLIVSSETFRLFSSDSGTYKEARPFFASSNNLIDDHFDGNVARASQTIHSHTFVFTMYYAQFCGISRRMREPFEKAAAFYHERIQQNNHTVDKFHVKFVAVDCFYHDGQCRKSYKLNYYPQMFLYIQGTRGYQYFGPAMKLNLIEFVEKIRMPVVRLTNLNEYYEFIIQHESSVLGYFNFSNDSERIYYSLFVQAALKHIEYDNEHPVRFAVILNQTIIDHLSELYHAKYEKPLVIMHQLGSTPQIFPNMLNNFTTEHLFQWVVDEYKSPYVGWLVPKNRYFSRSPSSHKSTLFDALNKYDNLLVFYTSNRFDELKLRQIYFHLSNCDTKYSITWQNEIENFYNHSLANMKLHTTKNQRHLLSSCCQYMFSKISTVDLYELCLFNRQIISLNMSENNTKQCSIMLNNSTLQIYCYKYYCEQWLKNSTSIYKTNLKMNHEIVLEKRKEKFYYQSNGNYNQFMTENIRPIGKYKNLLCYNNSTWLFRLIDSKVYPNFGQNIALGNVSRSIIVLQSRNEQHFVLNDEQVTNENICNLVYDITNNLRLRSLATISNDKNVIKNSNSLIELSTNSFHSTVFNSNKNVIVIYYTKWCGFCQSIWPIIYQTKKFFNKFSDLIFTRIQGDKHDLPWHLTVFSYPTIILFPNNRQSYSISFPHSTESITTINLIKFILYHLYIDDSINQTSCRQTNNSFSSMLSSNFIDFSQLSYLVKSFS